MTLPKLPVKATGGPTNQSSSTEPANQSSLPVKPGRTSRRRRTMIRKFKNHDPSPNQSSVADPATEPDANQPSSAPLKPTRKRAFMVRKFDRPSGKDSNHNQHQVTTTSTKSDKLRTSKFRALREKTGSGNSIDQLTRYTRPGALFISSSFGTNTEAVEEDVRAGEAIIPPGDKEDDVEEPKLHEVEAKLVEEGDIVHGEVIHYSRARVACLLSLLIMGIGLVIVLATILTRKRGRSVVPSTPTMQPSTQPTQSVSGRLYDLLLPISGEKLMNSSTPQYKAISWLTSDDPSMVAHNQETQDWVLKERYVIALLYFEWFTPEVSRKYNFMSNLSVCEWKFEDLGIYCFETGRDIGHVAQVNIFGTNHPIQGTLPSELAALESLEYLALPSHDNLTGTIPSEFGTLGELVSFVITDCSLTGTIPEQIRDLSKLNWFDVRNNRLEGTLPELSKRLIVFEVFVVSGNLLTGTIPDFSQINLFRLKTIALDNNLLTGTIPTSFWTLTSLEQLFLANNALEGTLPTDLSSASVLSTLYGSFNALTGSLPQILPDTMILFGLSNNQLNGSIPSEMGNLSQLAYVYLDNNNLSGPIPSEIGRLVNLVDLYLSDNQLTGTISSEFGLLVNAGSFLLGNNDLTGEIPSSLSNIGILNPNGPCHVELQNTDITGSLDPAFCSNNTNSTLGATSKVFASCLGDSANVECSCCHACCNATFCSCDSSDDCLLEDV